MLGWDGTRGWPRIRDQEDQCMVSSLEPGRVRTHIRGWLQGAKHHREMHPRYIGDAQPRPCRQCMQRPPRSRDSLTSSTVMLPQWFGQDGHIAQYVYIHQKMFLKRKCFKPPHLLYKPTPPVLRARGSCPGLHPRH